MDEVGYRTVDQRQQEVGRIMSRVDLRVIIAVVAFGIPACSTGPERNCCGVGSTPVTALVDPDLPDETVPLLDVKLCESLAARTHETLLTVSQKSDPPKRKFNILVLSGGGAYGAYSAGVLAGWTENGTRPSFEVVTGISTGALVATLAFLGPERDPDLKRLYTTVRDEDVYSRKSDIRALFSDSLRESEPLARLIDSMVDEQLLKDVAAQHAKGRRLYVGTTHLDARRLVVWDMGEIGAGAARRIWRCFERCCWHRLRCRGIFLRSGLTSMWTANRPRNCTWMAASPLLCSSDRRKFHVRTCNG